MTHDKDQDDRLSVFFDAARRQAPTPSADLMARVLADAQGVQPSAAGPATAARPARGGFRSFFRTLGGWPALAGLAAAAIAGVWIGVNPPAGIADQLAGLWGGGAAYYVIDLDQGAGFDFLEGAS